MCQKDEPGRLDVVTRVREIGGGRNSDGDDEVMEPTRRIRRSSGCTRGSHLTSYYRSRCARAVICIPVDSDKRSSSSTGSFAKRRAYAGISLIKTLIGKDKVTNKPGRICVCVCIVFFSFFVYLDY